MKETFGERIKALRQKKHLTQEQVASMLMVNRKAISHYENDIREPSFETLILMTKVYGVTANYLLGIDSDKVIDVSTLSDEDYEMAASLVELLEKKNDLIQRHKK